MGEAAKKQKSTLCETSFVGNRDANGDSEIEYIGQWRVASTGAARNNANLKKLGEGRLVQSMVLLLQSVQTPALCIPDTSDRHVYFP